MGNNFVDSALANVQGRNLGVQVAAILLGCAHVDHHDLEHRFVDNALANDFQRRKPDPFLLHFRQGSREGGRHRAAHVGVVDMTADEADDFARVKDRLPQHDVGCMGRAKSAIGVVGHADVAGLVVIDHIDDRSVVDPWVPGCAQRLGRRKGEPSRCHERAGKILGFLDEGRMSRAYQCVCHALRSRDAVVREDLQHRLVESHPGIP